MGSGPESECPVTTTPPFEDAVAQFREFLLVRRLPVDVVWVFRDDILHANYASLHVAVPVPVENAALAKAVYQDTRAVEGPCLLALGRYRQRSIASVWRAKSPEDLVQGAGSGLRLSVAEPVALVRGVPPGLQWLWRLLPGYTRVQRQYRAIGTRAWARA